MKTLSDEAFADRQAREAESAWCDAIELDAYEALGELVALKMELTHANSDDARRGILWRITTCKDRIATLVKRPALKSLKRMHSSLAVQKDCDALITKYERNPTFRRTVDRKIRKLKSPGRKPRPIAMWAAIKRNRNLVQGIVQYFVLNGEPPNAGDLKGVGRSPRVVRDAIAAVLGMKGRPGRKARKS